MPTARTIESSLFAFAPKESAMAWDNVGLLLGNPERAVSRVLVALDITESVADEAIAWGADLIVAHHPVMNCKWLPVQTVRSDTPQGHLLTKLLCARIPAICMHTNLDVAKGGVNDVLAEALKLVDPGPLTDDGLGRVGHLATPASLPEFIRQVSHTLHCGGVRYADAGKIVSRVAVGGGACGDCADQAIAAGCDTFLTADLSYHQFLDAVSKGINLIDAGHFPTEDLVCAAVIDYLKAQFPELTVVKSSSHREVIQYYTAGE